MSWQLFDHALAFFLAAFMPLESWFSFRRLIRGVEAGDPRAKTRAYQKTIALQWTVTGSLIVAWPLLSRSWDALGLGIGTWSGALAGAVGLGVGLLFVVAQQRTVARLPDDRLDKLRSGLGDVAKLLPATPRERRWFSVTSITAGICEEILYRGFAIWYLTQALPAPAAVVASSLVFGLGHAYQGVSGIIKTSVVGLVLASIYVASGTLWAPILIHAIVDLSAGAIGRRLAGPATASR